MLRSGYIDAYVPLPGVFYGIAQNLFQDKQESFFVSEHGSL